MAAPLPPPSKLWSSGYWPLVSYGYTAILWFNWGPWWDCSSDFSDVSYQPTGFFDEIGWNFPPFGYWISSTGNFFAKRRTSIFSSQPSSSFLDCIVPVPFGAVSDPSILDEVEQEIDALCSLLHSTLFEAGVCHDGSTADPSTPIDLQPYDHILSVVLKDLGKSELLARNLPFSGSWIRRSRSNQGLGP